MPIARAISAIPPSSTRRSTTLIAKDYAAKQRASIDPDARHAVDRRAVAATPPREGSNTTHFSVVDSRGNAVSNTYTLNFSYGVGLVAEGTGVLLNNELDDFTAAPGASNAYGLVGFEANLPGPGKRPLSSMSPTIVLKDGKPVLVTGSPGGSRIISTVLQVIVNVLDYKMDVAAAVAAPRLHHQWLPDEVRVERGFPDDVLVGLKAMGHLIVEPLGQTSANSIRGDRRTVPSARPIRAPAARRPRDSELCRLHGTAARAWLARAAARATTARLQETAGETHMSTADPTERIERAEIEDTSLLAFYRDMNAPERRTFWACAAGWALDGMDFMIYPLVIGTIIALWKVDAGIGRARRHRDAAGLRDRRLARRLSLRPYRPGQDAPDHHHLVLVLLAGLRGRAEFRAAPDRTRACSASASAANGRRAPC